MSYPFVAANAQYGTRKGPVKAFVIHMAEGGGTVGYLSRPNPRGVSVHYVIEYSGQIVQMVRESEASGSINPNDLRTTDDPLVYGATVRKAVMGSWDHDPNSAVISCEIEGFAASGPNIAQRASLERLTGELRARYPGIGLLGHRDYQDYKPCPGKLIRWADLGGHGPQVQEADVYTETTIVPGGGTFVIPPATKVTGFQIDATGAIVDGPSFGPAATPSNAHYDATVTTNATRGGPFLRVIDGVLKGFLISEASVTVKPAPPVDCAQAILDAKAAEHERTRALAIALLETL